MHFFFFFTIARKKITSMYFIVLQQQQKYLFALQCANNTRAMKNKNKLQYPFCHYFWPEVLESMTSWIQNFITRRKLLTCSTWKQHHTHCKPIIFRGREVVHVEHRKWQGKCWQDKTDAVMFYLANNSSCQGKKCELGNVSETHCQTCSQIQ